MEQIEKRRKLNLNGVKDSGNMWRPFNGEHYIMWTVERVTDEAGILRRHGIRARLRGDHVFVHQDDQEKAAKVDRDMGFR